MALYDTIKALEAQFPVPKPTKTITVGTLDAQSGEFQYAVPTYTQKVQAPPVQGAGPGANFDLLMGGRVVAVNVFELKLRFLVTGRQQVFAVSLDGRPAIQASADAIDVDAGFTDAVSFTLLCDGVEFRPELPLTITRPLAGAGAMMIPALPVTIIYAPPVDQQKKNVASWTATDITGTTTTVSIGSQNSVTVPQPSPFESVTDLSAALKAAASVLGAVKDPSGVAGDVSKGLNTLAGLLGNSTRTSTGGVTVSDQQSLTVTLSGQNTVATPPNGRGPGAADVVYFLKNAKVAWFSQGRALRLALLDWEAEDTLTVSLLKDRTQVLDVDQNTRDALVALDPLATGGPTAVLPAGRFVHVATFDVNAPHSFALSYTLSVTDLQQRSTTMTQLADDTASALPGFIGVPKTEKVLFTFTQSSAAQRATTQTVTRQVQFFANPDEYYSVEVLCDVIFGTFAFRSVASAPTPRIRGQVIDVLRRPRPNTEVIVRSNGQEFRTMTDANGEFAFRAASVDPATAEIVTGTSRHVATVGGMAHPLTIVG